MLTLLYKTFPKKNYIFVLFLPMLYNMIIIKFALIYNTFCFLNYVLIKGSFMKYTKYILKLIITLIFCGVILLLIFKTDFPKTLNFDSIREKISACGHFAGPVYIVIFILRTLLIFFPYSVMVILGGSLFGHINAFVYSLIAVFFSATLGFYVSRYVLRDFMRKLLKDRVEYLDTRIQNHGFKIIFLMRISTIFPLDVLSYASGLTKVKYSQFILGTMIGILPETFSLAYLGNNLKKPLSTKFVIAVILVAATVTVPFLSNKIKKNKKINKKINKKT